MLRVKRVEIIGMHKNPGRALFDPNTGATYIFGPNGAGKSTILQAIQLGVLGYIPGTGKKPADILKHAWGTTIQVSVELTDGADQNIKITRQWARVGSTTNSSVTVVPKSEEDHLDELVKTVEMPVFNFNAFVSMTANQLKDWFIGFLPQCEDENDWESGLRLASSTQVSIDEDLLKEVLASVGSQKGIAAAAALNDYIKQMKQSLLKELAAYEGTLGTLVYYDDVDPSITVASVEQSRKTLAERISNVRKHEADLFYRRSAEESNQRVLAKLSEMSMFDGCETLESVPEYQKILQDIADTEAEQERNAPLDSIDALTKERDAVQASLYASNAEINNLSRLLHSTGDCPYTCAPCEIIKEKINTQFRADYEAELKKWGQLKDRLGMLTEGVNKLTADRENYRQTINELQSEKSEISRKFSEYQSIRESLVEVPEVPELEDSATLADLEAEHSRLDSLMWKLGANAKFAEIQDKVFVEIARTKQNIETLKLWEKFTGVNGIQTQMMLEPFNRAEVHLTAYIQKLLGDDCRVHFEMTEKSNSFSFGIQRDQNYIPYEVLSSGEKCMFAVAMLNYILEVSPDALKVILLDDVFDHLDDANMCRLLSFAQAETDKVQYIIAGAKKPPEGVEPSIVLELSAKGDAVYA